MTNPAEQLETDQAKVQANKPETADLPKTKTETKKVEPVPGTEVDIWTFASLKGDGRLHCVFQETREGKLYLVGLVVPKTSNIRFKSGYSPLSNANANSISIMTRTLGMELERIYVPGKGTGSYIQALTSM